MAGNPDTGLPADAASGTDGPGSDAGVSPAAAVTLCRSAFEALFQLYADCNGYSYDALSTLLDPVSGCSAAGMAVAAGRMIYDPAAGAACLDALKALTCSQLASMPTMALGGCQKALAGAVGAGGTCYAQALFGECQTGHYCGGGGGGCPGTCTPQIKVGQACTPDDECQPGATCNRAAGRCAADATQGGHCRGAIYGECLGGLACMGGTDAVAGTCAPRLTSGSCHDDGECAPKYRCVGAAAGPGTCAPLKKIGDPCTPGAGDCGFTVGYCDGSKCVEYPREGGACGTVAGEIPLCLYGYCDTTGTCAAYKPIGATCTPMSDQCGQSAECDAATQKCSPLCGVP